MKKFVILIIVASFVSVFSAQTQDLTADWLLTKVDIKGEIQEHYYILTFKEDGKMEIMGFDMGTWKYDEKNKQIVMESTIDKDFNGKTNVLKLDSNELILEKDSVKYYYTRINEDEIARTNKTAKLSGVWKSQNEYNETQYLKFELPDELTVVGIFDGGISETHGTWIYQPEENAFIVIARTHFCDGKNILLKRSSKEFEFENNGQTLKAVKVDSSLLKIEQLNFTENDIENGGDGEIPYGWRDLYEMINSLKNVKQLCYRKGVLIQGIGVLDYSPIIIDVKSDEEKQLVKFSYKRISNGDTLQYREEVKDKYSQNSFFPEEEPAGYRIVGQETITVPAGTFKCTVIEGVGSFDDEKFKFWMINDKPGIYAKIITTKKSFDEQEYHVIELDEIR